MKNNSNEVLAFNLKVHHIKFAVSDVSNFSSMLVNNLKFKLLATKHENDQEIPVYEHGLVKFLVQDKNNLNSHTYSSLYSGMNSYPADTAFDVCLECNNIEKIVKSVNSQKSFSQDVKVFNMTDDNGIVKWAVVKSPIGNIYHTLVELSNYKGKFLPGFKVCEENISNSADLISHIDHIAVCLNFNQTESVYNWYAHCFGFKRVLINQDDHREDGFAAELNKNGLRLKEAVCPEMFIETAGEINQSKLDNLTRIVFAESLTNDKSNPTSVDNFILGHGGPGIQHLAFGCNDLFKTADAISTCGIECLDYPAQYYEDLDGFETVNSLGITVDELKKGKILLEYHKEKPGCDSDFQSESSIFKMSLEDQLKVIENTEWYILQLFTKPIFIEKTLFFEFIQRFNTPTGLGASNISTIWKYYTAAIYGK